MTKVPSPGKRYFHIYCDESSHVGTPANLLLGGVIIERSLEPLVDSELGSLFEVWNTFGEMKWGKVSRAKAGVYKSFLDYYLSQGGTIRFCAAVLPKSSTQVHAGKRDSKAMSMDDVLQYLVTQIFSRYIVRGDQIDIYVDERQTQPALAKLLGACNAAYREDLRFQTEPVRAIRSIRSHDSRMIQLADVLMGAIAFEVNGQNLRPDASEAKIGIRDYLASRLGVASFLSDFHSESDAFVLHHLHSVDAKKRHAP